MTSDKLCAQTRLGRLKFPIKTKQNMSEKMWKTNTTNIYINGIAFCSKNGNQISEKIINCKWKEKYMRLKVI